MSLLINALQPSITRELLAVSGHTTQNIGELLSVQSGFLPTFEGSPDHWKLAYGEHKSIAHAFAGECGRLASASFQSFSNVANDLNSSDAIPWALVKSYYAAFYAGHSLLRAFGWSCTYLHASQLQTFQTILQPYGVQPRPPKDLYKIRVVGRCLELSIVSGGTHEGFWRVFYEQLQKLTAQVLTSNVLPTMQSQEVWAQLSSFSESLTREGANVSWLSEVRNSVQYRQEKDVWFPKKTKKQSRSTLSRIALDWRKPPATTIDRNVSELRQFLSTCTFLVSLCRELLERVGERCNVGKSFAKLGPLHYLKSIPT